VRSARGVSRRRCVVVTGSRAEYGLLRPIMAAINAHASLELQVVASGMHMLPEHGNTVEEIVSDGFAIAATVPMTLGGSAGMSMGASVGIGILGFSQAFEGLKPDIVVVLGDRGEPFAAAIAAAHMNIPVAHIHGGDVSGGGNIDESVRHAITKLAHIHFPATGKSAGRILSLGEEPWRVHVVGAPGLDSILKLEPPEWRHLEELLGAPLERPYFLVVQHPVTVQAKGAAREMRETFAALERFSHPVVCVFPNADAGAAGIIKEIEKVRERPRYRVYASLPHAVYVSLMRGAAVLIGNSSSGIIEAPSLGLPVVNIGSRQDGRERGRNVIDVPSEREAIGDAVDRALNDWEFRAMVEDCVSPYGDGRASDRVAAMLAKVELGRTVLMKRFVDVARP